MKDKDEKNESENTELLLNEALKAYGIDRKYLLSHRITGADTVIIVTAGGSKAEYTRGFPVKKLTFVQITGQRQ